MSNGDELKIAQGRRKVVREFQAEIILKVMDERMNRLLVEQQNKYYLNQLGMMENMIKSDRAFRHDLKNHLLSLDSYLRNEDIEVALAYMEQMRRFEQNRNRLILKVRNTYDGEIRIRNGSRLTLCFMCKSYFTAKKFLLIAFCVYQSFSLIYLL